jgi:hypothetical protein
MNTLETARTKLDIKEALYGYIYGPLKKKHEQRLEKIIKRNCVLGNFTHLHFTYKGQLYNIDNTPPPLKRNRLVLQLRDAMDQYLLDQEEINAYEVPHVVGYISQVLNASNSFVDYMKIFPEAIHAPLHDLINTCPCRTSYLSEEKISLLKEKTRTPVDLIKQRLVSNLLL